MTFYHITTPEQWGKYAHSPYFEADSLLSEGFIHGSYDSQLTETLRLYFQPNQLVLLLKIDPSVLTSKLVIETSRNGDKFPHIYGPINKEAILYIVHRSTSLLNKS